MQHYFMFLQLFGRLYDIGFIGKIILACAWPYGSLSFPHATLLSPAEVPLSNLPLTWFYREWKLLLQDIASVRHCESERLLPFLGIYQHHGLVGIVTEWMNNGSLHSLIHEVDKRCHL